MSNQYIPHSDIVYETFFINKKDNENAIFNLLRYYDNENIYNSTVEAYDLGYESKSSLAVLKIILTDLEAVVVHLRKSGGAFRYT